MRNLGLMDPAFLGGLGLPIDAAAYISAVEAADGQALETGVKDAINAFVLGCEADGIGNAIKASCILAGARTLAGALVPLVGPAPTNYNFVSGDYNRKTGLVGNGSTKYLDSNRNNNADPQDSKHISVWQSTPGARNTSSPIGGGAQNAGGSHLLASPTERFFRIHFNGAGAVADVTNVSGLWGASRSNNSTINGRYANTNYALSITSATPFLANIAVFGRSVTAGSQNLTNARLAFYSIGESLDLALLDARVTALVNALAVAIP